MWRQAISPASRSKRQADRGRGCGRASLVGDLGVEVDGARGAVGAALEGLQEPLGVPIVAGVDVGGVEPALRGVHVRDEDLRQGSLVEHRPRSAAVHDADERQDEADAGLHAHVEAPVLPRHLVAVEAEAGARRLLHVDRARDVALRADRRGVVVARSDGRHGNDPRVDDPDELLRVEVVDRHDAFHRASPGGRVAAALVAGDPLQTMRLLLGRPEVARRAAEALEGLEVSNAALAHGGLPVRVVLDEPARVVHLGERQVRLHARDLLPRRRDVSR